MKKFNNTKAREGAELITRGGKPVKVLLFDRTSKDFPIVAIIDNRKVIQTTADGKYYIDKDSENDIMLK